MATSILGVFRAARWLYDTVNQSLQTGNVKATQVAARALTPPTSPVARNIESSRIPASQRLNERLMADLQLIKKSQEIEKRCLEVTKLDKRDLEELMAECQILITNLSVEKFTGPRFRDQKEQRQAALQSHLETLQNECARRHHLAEPVRKTVTRQQLNDQLLADRKLLKKSEEIRQSCSELTTLSRQALQELIEKHIELVADLTVERSTSKTLRKKKELYRVVSQRNLGILLDEQDRRNKALERQLHLFKMRFNKIKQKIKTLNEDSPLQAVLNQRLEKLASQINEFKMSV